MLGYQYENWLSPNYDLILSNTFSFLLKDLIPSKQIIKMCLWFWIKSGGHPNDKWMGLMI